MKGRDDTSANMSRNTTFKAMLRQGMSRRQVLQGGLVGAGLVLAGGPAAVLGAGTLRPAWPCLGFRGFRCRRPIRWWYPQVTRRRCCMPGGIRSDGPVFKLDGSHTAEEQIHQAGMHHDAIHFFPLPMESNNSTRGSASDEP